MAIVIKTEQPNQLLEELNRAITNGLIQTWQVDCEGDYTISRFQWFQHAWLRPYVETGRLVFGIVQSSSFVMTCQLYGVFNGRFVATLLTHFDFMIEHMEITPMLVEKYDVFSND